MSGVTLLRPLWLLALPLLAAAGWWLARRAGGLGDWERAVAPELLAAMRAMGRVAPGRGGDRGWTLPAAAALIGLGLAGPAVERRDAIAFRNLDGVVFVLDASPSATGGAGWTDLIGAGRAAVAALGSRPGGLVVFAGDAYVATDMTADARELGQTLSLVDAETVPDPGSRPARGLALARRMVDEARILAGDVVLLGDGGGIGPAAMAEAGRIAESGARLSLVAPDPGPEAAALAAAGGGVVFPAGDALALADWIAEESRAKIVRQDHPLLYWSDLGRWVAALALLPLFLAFRRMA